MWKDRIGSVTLPDRNNVREPVVDEIQDEGLIINEDKEKELRVI